MPAFAARRQSQLSIEELLHFRWLLGGALALLSIWTLFYLEAAIWPVALLATIAIAIAMFFPQLPGRVAPAAWRFGVPVISVFFALDLLTHEMIPAFVRLNVLLVLHRAISYRNRREDLQLAVLCLFLVVVTGVLTVSLIFPVQILIFTGLAMVFLFVVNLIQDATDGAPAANYQWAQISRARLLRRLVQAFDLRLMGLAGGLFLTVVVVSVVIFLAIPRFQMENALSFLELNRARSLTGFSETIALGEVTDITQDHSIAMRVDVVGTTFPPSVPYWRMVVLDEYAQGVFRVSRAVLARVGARSAPVLELAPDWPASVRPDRAAPRYVVFMEGGISRFLPLPGMFRSLHFKETQDLVENPVFRVYATDRQSAVLVSYRIEGADFSGVIPDPEFGTRTLRAPGFVSASINDASGAGLRFLSYPDTTRVVPVSPAAQQYLRGVVAEITGGRQLDAGRFARRACEYLARHHTYSLGTTLAPEDETGDPAVRWLRGDSPGHCEFFAAAFTLLSRTAGFPTRAVTGFKGGTWNAYENYFMVRNSDAHAWCEVFDGSGAWFRVDPTPGGGGVASTADPMPLGVIAADASVTAYLDSLRMLWYRRIVNFDQRSQREVAGSVQHVGRTAMVWAQATVTTLGNEFLTWWRSPWTFRSKGDLLFVAILLLATATVMKRFGIGTSDLFEWFRTGERPTRRRAGELLRRLEQRIAEPPARRWDPLAARVVARDLTMIRFGRAAQWPEPLRVFRAARRML